MAVFKRELLFSYGNANEKRIQFIKLRRINQPDSLNLNTQFEHSC
jgi:hypothetical protein